MLIEFIAQCLHYNIQRLEHACSSSDVYMSKQTDLLLSYCAVYVRHHVFLVLRFLEDHELPS